MRSYSLIEWDVVIIQARNLWPASFRGRPGIMAETVPWWRSWRAARGTATKA